MPEPTFADVDELVGPATPHFAYQLRARVRELVLGLPEEHTVRRYADKGLLPPVEHSPAGYRRFTQHHLYCLQNPGLTLFLSGKRIVQAAGER